MHAVLEGIVDDFVLKSLKLTTAEHRRNRSQQQAFDHVWASIDEDGLLKAGWRKSWFKQLRSIRKKLVTSINNQMVNTRTPDGFDNVDFDEDLQGQTASKPFTDQMLKDALNGTIITVLQHVAAELNVGIGGNAVDPYVRALIDWVISVTSYPDHSSHYTNSKTRNPVQPELTPSPRLLLRKYSSKCMTLLELSKVHPGSGIFPPILVLNQLAHLRPRSIKRS